ncbi:MAG: 16S rRNA (guanine(527)-N(7))-methyltransferase RsmG [Candidatus Puniceispirillales bacterium]
MKTNSYNDFCLHQNVSRETYEKLVIFYKTLIKWQKSINLISKSSIENIWVRHILDSAQLYRYTKKINGNILDFGSGAGFPGLILAMMGNKNIHLVESDQKKCTFLREVAMLSETDVTIHNNRIENLKYFDVELITARALAPLNKLINYAEAFSKKSVANKILPKMLFLKGKSYKNEILELSKTKRISFQEYQSISDDFGKILYINSINVLNINND